MAAGAPDDTPVEGIDERGELARVILRDQPGLDVAKARADVLSAGHRLHERDPAIGAVVLECTNMVPYAADIRAATGLPVFSIESFVAWFQSGLSPRRF